MTKLVPHILDASFFSELRLFHEYFGMKVYAIIVKDADEIRKPILAKFAMVRERNELLIG